MNILQHTLKWLNCGLHTLAGGFNWLIWLVFIEDEYWWIWMNIDDCWWLLMIIDGCWWLLMIDDQYWWLSKIANDYWWLLMVVDEYWRVLMSIVEYCWLQRLCDIRFDVSHMLKIFVFLRISTYFSYDKSTFFPNFATIVWYNLYSFWTYQMIAFDETKAWTFLYLFF